MTESDGPQISIDAPWEALYIDGEWVDPGDRDRIDLRNPATRETITTIPAATAEDVNRAFEAATRAQTEWAATTPDERAAVVRRTASLIEEFEPEIREILAVEGGSTKPKQDIEHGGTVTFVHDAASFAFRASGDHAQSKIPGKENIVRRDPVGVVGVISPWNVPLKLSRGRARHRAREQRGTQARSGDVDLRWAPARATVRGRRATRRRAQRGPREGVGRRRSDRFTSRLRRGRVHRLDRGRPDGRT